LRAALMVSGPRHTPYEEARRFGLRAVLMTIGPRHTPYEEAPGVVLRAALMTIGPRHTPFEDRKSRSRSLGDRFDRCRHASFALGAQRILAKCMDLISFQFRMFLGGRQADASPRLVDFFSELETFFDRMTKEFLQHSNHVGVGVFRVVPKDDVVTWLSLRFLILFIDRSHDDFFGDCCIRITHQIQTFLIGMGCFLTSATPLMLSRTGKWGPVKETWVQSSDRFAIAGSDHRPIG